MEEARRRRIFLFCFGSCVDRAQVPETDVSEVLDFRKIAPDGASAVIGVSRVEGCDWPVYRIDKQPGK